MRSGRRWHSFGLSTSSVNPTDVETCSSWRSRSRGSLLGVPEPVRTAFETSRPLDLFSTLAPIGRGPWLRLDRNEGWRATRTPCGPSTMHLTYSGGRIEVEAWGPGGESVSARAAALCGQEDGPGGFQPRHRLISDLHRRHPAVRLTRTGPVFEALGPVR